MSEGAEYDYTITNSLGQVLQSGKINDSVNKISLESFPNGLYIVTINNKTYTQTDRIILQ